MDSDEAHRYEADINDVKGCPRCNSESIIVRAVFARNGMPMLRKICQECGYEGNIPKLTNKTKRTATAQQRWAQSVKHRDGYHCILCGSAKDLEAHHIIPVKNDRGRKFVYNVDNGVTLCHDCHLMAHGMEVQTDGF